MFFHRGHRLRPELPEFERGIHKAREAIDNSIGGDVVGGSRRMWTKSLSARGAAGGTTPGGAVALGQLAVNEDGTTNVTGEDGDKTGDDKTGGDAVADGDQQTPQPGQQQKQQQGSGGQQRRGPRKLALDLSRVSEQRMSVDETAAKDDCIGADGMSTRERDLLTSRTAQKLQDETVARRLLGPVHEDYAYLQELLSDPSILAFDDNALLAVGKRKNMNRDGMSSGPSGKRSRENGRSKQDGEDEDSDGQFETISGVIKDGIRFLETRALFWEQQQPFGGDPLDVGITLRTINRRPGTAGRRRGAGGAGATSARGPTKQAGLSGGTGGQRGAADRSRRQRPVGPGAARRPVAPAGRAGRPPSRGATHARGRGRDGQRTDKVGTDGGVGVGAAGGGAPGVGAPGVAPGSGGFGASTGAGGAGLTRAAQSLPIPPKPADRPFVTGEEDSHMAIMGGGAGADTEDSVEYLRSSLTFARLFLKRLTTLDVAEKPRVEGNVHCSIGNTLVRLGQPQKALIPHLEDLRISSENDYYDAQLRALSNVGHVYAILGNHAKAIEHWMRRRELVEKDIAAEHEMRMLISQSYMDLGNYDQAIAAVEPVVSEARLMRAECMQAVASGQGQYVPRMDRRTALNYLYGSYVMACAWEAIKQPKTAVENFELYVAIGKQIGNAEAVRVGQAKIDELAKK